jgi:hypothetical protein
MTIFIGSLYKEYIGASVLFEIDFLGFRERASVTMGEVTQSQMEVCVLRVSTLAVKAFQFDVEALLLGFVDEV